MPFHQLPQLRRGDDLNPVAPLVQVPGHLDPAAGGERDAQRAVWFLGHHLVGVELEFAGRGGRAGRKAPDDRLVLRVRVEGAEGLGGIGVEVEVGITGEGLPGDLGAGDAIHPKAPEGATIAQIARDQVLPDSQQHAVRFHHAVQRCVVICALIGDGQGERRFDRHGNDHVRGALSGLPLSTNACCADRLILTQTDDQLTKG